MMMKLPIILSAMIAALSIPSIAQEAETTAPMEGAAAAAEGASEVAKTVEHHAKGHHAKGHHMAAKHHKVRHHKRGHHHEGHHYARKWDAPYDYIMKDEKPTVPPCGSSVPSCG